VILVDTSVWIDHLHRSEPDLLRLLALDEVGQHPLVLEELALGNIQDRSSVLTLIGALTRLPVLTHDELIDLVEGSRLWGRGLSAVDAHLLGSVRIQPGAVLWTRDRRLLATAAALSVATLSERT
jgi:predicted nucleic acid-binding protein